MKTLFTCTFLLIVSFNSWSQSSEWKNYDNTNSSIPFDKVFYLEVDNDGNIWGGTSVTNMVAHLFKFDGTDFTNYYSNKWVYDIKLDDSGNIWTLSSKTELSMFDGSTWTDYKNTDLSYYSSPLYIDGQGNKWANPMFTGTLLKFDGTNWTNYTAASEGYPENKINTINGYGNHIYFGTNDSGLIHYDGAKWETFNKDNSPMPNNRIYSSYIDKNDSLWLLCDGGFIVTMKDNNWSVFYDSILKEFGYGIEIDGKGNIWVALSTKVIKITNGIATVFNSNNSILPAHSLLTLKIDNENTVWVGSRFGLFSYKENVDTTITITGQPQNITIDEGGFVKFEVGAQGQNLSYQWQKDGLNIPYATLENYQIASAKTSDAGKYKCIIKNTWGQISSDEAILTVNTNSGIQKHNNYSEITIYPNPIEESLTVFYHDLKINDISIIDVSGKLIYHKIYSSNPDETLLTIERPSKIVSGVYLIKINTDKGNLVKKVLFK